MKTKFGHYGALLVAAALLSPQLAVATDAMQMPRAERRSSVVSALAIPPAGKTGPSRIVIPEPSRRTPPPMPSLHSVHVTTSRDIHRAFGARSAEPPMLRPSEIDRVLTAARTNTKLRAVQRIATPEPDRRMMTPPRSHGGRVQNGEARALQSVDQSSTGTGINPWWHYQESSVPGDGRVLVNVGTGNLLLQDDDMSVPHKGITLAFRRTYNSQEPASQPGDFYTWQSLYGNGWTNTFDAHMRANDAAGLKSVYDTDGARYDYGPNPGGGFQSITPGQHATLVYDGACGYLWTKKNGTTYYFWRSSPSATSCPSLSPIGGYAGRLHQIIGRNRNVFLTFNYTWDNGDASVNGKINSITVQAESGLTASLSFADVSGRRLLQQIVFPDGMTSVSYGYDSLGNLTSVSKPPNNNAGSRPLQTFGYQTVGTGSVLYWAASPRWCAATCGSDGAFTAFAFAGSDQTTSTVSTIAHGGVVNPIISDGSSSTALQPGYATGAVYYLYDYYATGASASTFRDTDGHATNWVVDSAGRITQTQECPSSIISPCPWLVSNETWDGDNNPVTQTDERGNETDYLHDPMGNTTAVAEPYMTTSQGSFQPTQIFDYDAFNNVVAYCDANEAHLAQADWTKPAPSVSSNDSLCASQAGSVPHWRATYNYPSYEPYGELASMTTPLGYTRTLSYAPAQQAGADYGLPTSSVGTSFQQIDGSTITPSETVWYDANGYQRCASKGQGIAVMSYDALGRMTSVADPDDSSANPSSICAKSTGRSGWNTQTTYTYVPDGLVQSSQTAAERVVGVSTTFTYDIDGNDVTETRHHTCTAANSCTAGVTTKWYDGVDRLVEVALPHDPADYYASSWLTRYLYDLSGGGLVSISGTSYKAYGNLFKTQEWVPPSGSTSPTWLDTRGSAFDGLDRPVTRFSFSPSSSTTVRATTMAYDATPATLGLLTSTSDPLGQTTTFSYDAAARTVAMTFSGDAGVTPNKSFVYDAVGHETAATSTAYGTETTRYDGDGRVSEVDEPTTGSVASPARMTYDYYPNGFQKDVNVASSALNANPLMSYAYRIDGARIKVHVGYGQQQGDFSWSYTDGRRPLSQADPYTGTVMPQPQAPVSAGTTYPPTSWTYDNAGQTHVLQLPETLAYTFSQDAEGQLAGWTAPWSGGTATMVNSNTTRGENVRQNLIGSGTTWWTKIANGASLRYTLSKAGGSLPAYTIDPANAVIVAASQEVYTTDPSANPTTVDCGLQTKTSNYDAASRVVSSTTTVSGGSGNQNCNGLYDPGPDTIPLYSYDAENHHTVIQSPDGFGVAKTVSWDPAGRPYNTGSILHYDGDRVLFITSTTGALSQVKVGTLGDIDASGHLTVLDRDYGGFRVSLHNDILYDAIGLGSTTARTTYQPSVPFSFPGSTNGRACTSGSCPATGDLEYNRLEGLDFAGLTFQGVRAVDNSTGQWTTPDAYLGDVHDPMSQKPFMWDRNNPYEYSDPSGYAADASGHDPNPGWGSPDWFKKQNGDGDESDGSGGPGGANSSDDKSGGSADASHQRRSHKDSKWRKLSKSEMRNLIARGIIDPHGPGTKPEGSRVDILVDQYGNLAVGNKDGSGEKELFGNVRDKPSGQMRSKPKQSAGHGEHKAQPKERKKKFKRL